MPRKRIVVGLLAAAALAACSTVDRQGPAVPASAPSASSGPQVPQPVGSSASAAEDDPPGLLTCARLAEAIAAGSLMIPGIVDGVVDAAETADAPVADAAERLKNAYDRAVDAKNKTNEPDAIAAVSAAASDMSGVCADSGLRTAG